MKKTLITFLLVLTSSLASMAQAPGASRPDIDELLNVMRVEQNMDKAMEQMRKVMANTMANSLRNTPADAAQATRIQNKVFDLIKEELSWPKLKPEMAQIYAEALSPEETKALIAFYKSPAGQNFLQKQPEIMAKSMALTQGKVMKLSPQINALVQAELQSAKSSATPAAPNK